MAKSSLGRGLGALFSETNAETGILNGFGVGPSESGGSGGNKPQTLSISKIHPNPDQPRRDFDESALRELTDSIRQNGVLQPILVRPMPDGTYEIVAGERRYQASKRAGLTEMPAVVKKISDADVFRLALIENIQRDDLSPIEEAAGYRKLLDEGNLTVEQLAKAVSKSRSAISNTMRLLNLPESVQKLMREGKLQAGHARALLSLTDGRSQAALGARAARTNMTVRQVENEVAKLLKQAEARKETQEGGGEVERPTSQEKPPTFLQGERRLSKALGTKVRVKQGKRKNTIEIDFHDAEELARILSHISEG